MSCEQGTKISTDHEHTHHFLYDQSTTNTSIKGICKRKVKGSSALAFPLAQKCLGPWNTAEGWQLANMKVAKGSH